MTLKPANSILDDVEHQRLLMDIEHVCTTANIPQSFVHTSMAKFCLPNDVEWVMNYPMEKAAGRGGLVITGSNSEPRCMAITGALIRNFIDARVVTLNSLIEDAKTRASDPTVMVIPNLFMSTHGKPMTSWQIQKLYDILLNRLVSNRLTVVYVQDMNQLADAYGSLMAEHLTNHFVVTK
jgi:hypothetical protein